MNGPGTKNGLLVISGEPGSGKSQLALDLLAQLSGNGVRFVFFDLKGELEDDPSDAEKRKNRKKFLDQTGAQYVRLIHQDLPINPLVRDSNDTVNAQIAYEIASLVRAFAPQLGAKQERAISDAYQNLATPDFVSLAQELEQNGATGVELATIQKIVDFNLFASAQTGISPEEWLRSSIVINLRKLCSSDNATSRKPKRIVNNGRTTGEQRRIHFSRALLYSSPESPLFKNNFTNAYRRTSPLL